MARRRLLQGLRPVPEGMATARFGSVRFDVDLSLHPDARAYYLRTHQLKLEPAFRRLLRPGAIFVDVGSGMGYWSAFATSLVRHSGQVHAFEPSPHTFPLLRRFAAANPSYHIKANNAALGSDAALRWMPFRVPAGTEHDPSKSVPGKPDLEMAEVQFGVFDDYADWLRLDLDRIGLIRLNVGGWLYDVVDGMRCVVERPGRRSPFLVVPRTDGEYPSPTPEETIAFFKTLNYRCFDATSMSPAEPKSVNAQDTLLFLPGPIGRR